MSVGAVILTLVSIAVTVMVMLCAAGRIRRNPLVGLRIAPLFRSETAWVTGHRAGIVPVTVSSIICIILTIVVIAVPGFAAIGTYLVLFFLLAGVAVAAIVGGRAASRLKSP